MLGLPDGVIACLFDLDGVVTQTARVHSAAWKDMFDGFLRQHAETTGTPFVPFERADYITYVDGKPRLDGTRSFLQSRGIELPEGTPDDPPGTLTVWGLSNKKNNLVLEMFAKGGVDVYPGTVSYIRSAKNDFGIKTAIVSSSANTQQVLEGVGLSDLFDVRVDGVIATERGLAGKPAPDTYLAAAKELNVTPAQAAVFEDALSGVAAGRAGNFALVVGVDRVGQAAELSEHGADIVVKDLAELMDKA